MSSTYPLTIFIDRATYHTLDVTKHLQNAVAQSGGRLFIPNGTDYNHYFQQDPAPGVPKKLTIWYRAGYGYGEQSLQYAERQQVQIDPYPSQFQPHHQHVTLQAGGVDPWTAANTGMRVYLRAASGGNAHLSGGVAKNGAAVTIWETVDAPNVTWHIQPTPYGDFYICSSTDQNYVLHQHGNKQENDGECTVWNKIEGAGAANTRVKFEPTDDGYFKIIFAHSNKCLHVRGGGHANGSVVSQWEWANAANVKWSFVPALNLHGGIHPAIAARNHQKVYLRAASGGNAHLSGGVAKNGAEVTIWETCDAPNLFWFVQPAQQGGFYICSAVDENFVLHQHGGKQENDGECTVWNKIEGAGAANTRVHFEPTSDGYFKIVFVHSNKCVHVRGGGSSNGTKVSQWEWADAANVKWSFIPA